MQISEGFLDRLVDKLSNSLKRGNRKKFATKVKKIRGNQKVKNALADFVSAHAEFEKTVRNNMSKADYEDLEDIFPGITK